MKGKHLNGWLILSTRSYETKSVEVVEGAETRVRMRLWDLYDYCML